MNQPQPISRRSSDRLAAFDIAVHGGRRIRMSSVGPATTVADLVRETRLSQGRPTSTMLIDGQPADLAQPLTDTSIRHGSLVESVRDRVEVAQPVEAVIDVVWITGPDAGVTTPLGTGAHLVGRAAGVRVRCDDRSLEPHHAMIDVDVDGAAWITQLCGLQPISVEHGVDTPGPPVCIADSGFCDDSDQLAPPTPIGIGTRITLGASVLLVRSPRPAPNAANRAASLGPDPWRVPMVRTPRPLIRLDDPVIEAPSSHNVAGAFSGGLLPAVLALAGAGLMAAVLGEVMFLLFGAIGALVALGTWIAARFGVIKQRRGARRRDRVAAHDFVEQLAGRRERVRAAHLQSVPTIESSVSMMRSRSAELWAVRPDHPGAFVVSVGEGEIRWQPNVTGLDRASSTHIWAAVERASRIERMPIPASLAAGTVTAVVGGDVGDHIAVAVARSMVLQLAAASGPADWRLAIVTARPDEWDGLSWLPHAVESGGEVRIAAPQAAAEMIGRIDDDGRHLLVVIDHVELLGTRTSVLRRLLASERPVAAIVICAQEGDVPAIATSALMIGRRGQARWRSDTRLATLAEPVALAGVGADAAFESAAAMACLIDPESVDGNEALPTDVSMIELLADSLGAEPARYAQRIAERWSTAGGDPAPATPIGVAADGVIEIDLVGDGPHCLLAGTTGAGKSELLRSLVVGLSTLHSPDQITFVLVDYKGGSTFDACAELPHVVGLVTDLDDRLATRALRSLEAELRRREHILRDAGATDLTSYRAAVGTHVRLPRLVVIVDEFAALAVQQPAFIGALLGVAQRGRSLGVHLLLATQRPNGVINDDIRANTNIRLALRVQDRSDSIDVIGDGAAATLPRTVPGRAVLRLGADELISFQTACCTGPAAHRVALAAAAGDETELQVLVGAIRAAARLNSVAAPHRPWLPELGAATADPADGDRDRCTVRDPSLLGVIDDPDHQRREPLRWIPGDGHLLLAGAVGSGTTTALLAIVETLALIDDSDRPEVFVIDAMGDARLDRLVDLPGCVAVVRLHETERLMRTLTMLCGEVADRKRDASDPGARRDIAVVIDGVAALRAELERLELYEQTEQLDTVVAQGLTVGISVVVSTAKPSAISAAMLGQIANRWVFHLAEAMDAPSLGVPAAAVPGPIPGRLIESRSGREAQIEPSTGEDAPPTRRDTSGVAAARNLSVLRDDVRLDELPIGACSAGDVSLPVGIAFDSLLPVELPIAGGEHVLVIGPSRSGRSAAVATLACSWSSLHPGGWVGCIAPRRSSARAGVEYTDVESLLTGLADAAPAPRLVVIDDAELVEDPGGALAALVSARHEGITVVAVGRPDSLRSTYGHWTLAVRRSRLGLAMAACSDIDGDLLSVSLPRRLPIPTRPGLAWLVADGERRLIQVARPDPSTLTST